MATTETLPKVITLSAGEAGTLRTLASEGIRQTAENWFDLARVLYRLRYAVVGKSSSPAHVVFGFETWPDYVETELGMHQSNVAKMIRTAEFFDRQMKGAWDGQILSPSRMKALACAPHKVITKKNLKEWMRKAISMHLDDLEAELHSREKRVSVGFSFSASVADEIRERLDYFCEAYEVESRSEALAQIILELTTPRGRLTTRRPKIVASRKAAS